MQAHYISRHNGAVQRLTKLIHTGSAAQNCFTIMDATAADALPLGVADNRIPAWILPAVPEATRLKMRPDLMIIEGLKNEDVEAFQQMGSYRATAMRQYTVHVIEVGYAANTRYLEKLQEKQEQHTRLCEALTAEGWKVQNTDRHQVILGTGGDIHSPTEALLNGLGVAEDDKRKKALRKLSALAVNKGQHIITCRRQLEAALRGAHQQGPFRYR
jgi:enoyl-CoA hydratase/carnithine racemase